VAEALELPALAQFLANVQLRLLPDSAPSLWVWLLRVHGEEKGKNTEPLPV
jgi:hypothetical protein